MSEVTRSLTIIKARMTYEKLKSVCSKYPEYYGDLNFAFIAIRDLHLKLIEKMDPRLASAMDHFTTLNMEHGSPDWIGSRSNESRDALLYIYGGWPGIAEHYENVFKGFGY